MFELVINGKLFEQTDFRGSPHAVINSAYTIEYLTILPYNAIISEHFMSFRKKKKQIQKKFKHELHTERAMTVIVRLYIIAVQFSIYTSKKAEAFPLSHSSANTSVLPALSTSIQVSQHGPYAFTPQG